MLNNQKSLSPGKQGSKSPKKKNNEYSSDYMNMMGSTHLTASTQPKFEHMANQGRDRWAQMDQASVAARISIETSQASQAGQQIVMVPTTKNRHTIADDIQMRAIGKPIQQNGSMSVMSLNGPKGIGKNSSGITSNIALKANFNSSASPFNGSDESNRNNVKNVTITQKMHGGALNPD